MPVRLSVKTDIDKFRRQLSDFQRKQLPYATAQAVNDLAFQVMRSERASLAKTFKNPRAFTLSGPQVARKATKANPTATVWIKPDRGRYLAAFEFGGKQAGVASRYPTGVTILSPKGIGLDRNGQLPRGVIARLLARRDCFAGTVNGVNGIWQRLPRMVRAVGPRRRLPAGVIRTELRLLVRFTDPRPVTKHLDFRKRAQALVMAQAPAALRAAMAKALRTAR